MFFQPNIVDIPVASNYLLLIYVILFNITVKDKIGTLPDNSSTFVCRNYGFYKFGFGFIEENDFIFFWVYLNFWFIFCF